MITSYDEHGIISSNIQTNPYHLTRNNEKVPFLNITSINEWKNVLRNNIEQLLVSRYEWEGLPDNIPVGYIEKTLVNKGELLLFKDIDGFFALPGSGKGYNVYGEYTSFDYISPVKNGSVNIYKTTENGTNQQAVIVKNNLDGRSEMSIVETYIHEMASAKSAIAVNRELKKTPFILEGANSKIIKSLYEQMIQIGEGRPYIAIDKSLNSDGDGIKAFDLKATNYSEDLQQEYDDIRSELLEFLGVNTNPNPMKKERMITDEVESNAQETNLNRDFRLRLRKDAAKKASEIFNMEITVKESGVFNDENVNRITDIGYDVGDTEGDKGI